MRISVLVPSYQRPADLARCLAALAAQDLMPDQVLIIARADDQTTIDTAKSWQAQLPLNIVEVSKPGQVHALNTGLSHCNGDIIAITDDDAAPRSDWLFRIKAHFAADPMVGGVGGRDWVHQQGKTETGERTLVGRVVWYGQVIGNHHIGFGSARDVDILKGANCAFRSTAIKPIGFDRRLRGIGAQVHNDMLASLAVKHAGWRLVYDPLVAVDHWPAPRHVGTERGERSSQIAFDTAFNQMLAISFLRPVIKQAMAIGWEIFVGTRDKPGILWLLILLASRDRMAFACWMSANRGRYSATRGWRT